MSDSGDRGAAQAEAASRRRAVHEAADSVQDAREVVVVLDFGGQYNQLIARRIRELHVYSELLPHTTPAAELARKNLKGIVFSGGPKSVYAPGAPDVDPDVFELGVPILGICYGMQLIAKRYEARVER
ncbi:MAG: hypothetical protein K6T83_16465, partial [Alicyclobacillus sp.]|nr:hypothetical protein [Alicyclobacillus sp.]